MRTEDGDIIYECLNGKPQAFGMLVDKYKEGIYAFAYAELGDFQDAQDVTQEIFLQAYRDLRSLRKWESFVFWLYRIARRRCVQRFRIRSRRVDRESIEDQDPTVMDAHSLSSYRDSQLSESLVDALDSLPEMQREVLMLRYFGGMNSKEIARAIGTSPGAIRVRLSRARAQLRKEMVTMMDTAFEGQKMPAGFTLRIVEAVKRIKINPMPRVAGLPWGLSLAMGIIITVVSLNPHLSRTSDTAIPASSSLPGSAQSLEVGEVSVDVLKITNMTTVSDWQGSGKGGELKAPNLQNALLMAPRAGGTWTKRADMSTIRSSFGVGVVNGKIYAIGGRSWLEEDGVVKNTVAETVEEYDPATDTWSKKADMPTAKHSFGVGVVNNKIYVIGGYQDGPLTTVEEYDPKTDKWTQKTDVPTKRAAFGTCVANGKIYTIGGGTWEAPFLNFSTVEEYDPANDTWTKRADMPTARLDLSASAVNGKIYAMGGFTHHVDLGNAIVEEYDPAADKWTRKTDMPGIRRPFSSVAANGRIYAIGGALAVWPCPRVSTVEEYDPITDKWAGKDDMPTPRTYLGLGAVNGKIYAIGGSTDDGPVSTVEEYTPGSQGDNVNFRGKLPTKWGEVKSE